MVFVISAPSGSGKSTLVRMLLESLDGLDFSVSYTTRPPRGAEKDGENYRFVTREQFVTMRDRGEFLEWAEVFGYFYGTARSMLEEAQKQGHDLVLDIDVQGAAQLKERLPEAVTVFILPPSREELEKRLRSRSLDPEGVIGRRLRDASKEIRNYSAYDYILVNDRLEVAAEKLKSIFLAERCRKQRAESVIQPILKTFEEERTDG
ncbi:MAG: guanylate kinase [Acidobacteria bacterium]|nr:guanylate kinase [Acidobacteriota bacterium]